MSASERATRARIWCLGSINADHIYHLPRLPAPGETLAAVSYLRMLGGKGANQSVAAARAGAEVRHVGAIGAEGGWMIDALAGAGVETRGVARQGGSSGHAVVMVTDTGENAIVIHPGANRALDPGAVALGLDGIGSGDWLLMQNETNQQVAAARIAREAGAHVAWSAAPFEVEAARAVLPFVTLLILNGVEAAQLEAALGTVDVPHLLITRGAEGAVWYECDSDQTVTVPAFSVPVRDTTGAGDCFAGYVVAGMAEGLGIREALTLASAAAALQVQRDGASRAIPTRAEVVGFLAQD